MPATPARDEPILLHAAGSLGEALTDVARAFETATGHAVVTKFAPSGLLCKEIADGAKADVFASANMTHPQALVDAGRSCPVRMFARNTLCALVAPGLEINSDNLLARMLEPTVTLGTSTPKSDPSGDYAFEVFARAEAVKPGTKAILEGKAQMLTGAADSAKPPASRNVYGWHVTEGRADIFLTYSTNAAAARKQHPGLQYVMLPDALAVAADYGLTVMKGAPAGAVAFAQFILSPKGQDILAGYGFATIGP